MATVASAWGCGLLVWTLEQWGMWKLTNTANNLSKLELGTGSLTGPPSSEISRPPILDQWPDWWISSLRGSRASRTPSPGNAAEKLMNAISGRTPLESFARLDPLSCSLKMCLDSSPKPTDQDIYLAGLIDGEGTISIWGKPGKQYYPTVQVGMSEKALPLLKELAEHYGGTVRRFRPATSAWSAGWTWSIFGAEARVILEKIHSSLRLKQAHATLALRLFLLIESLEKPTGKRHRWTTEAREHAAVLATMMTELNKKGPTEISELVKNHPILDPNNIWVTPQIDFLGMQQSFTGSFPKQGMTVSGTAYRLRPLVPHTSVGGGGVLPTPQVLDLPNKQANTTRWNGVNSLTEMAKTGMWPTPRSVDYKGATNPSETTKQRVADGTANLPEAVQEQSRWPSPKTRDGRAPGGEAEQRRHTPDLPTQVGGKLNPTWVEWLMGVPLGWTDLEPLATESYRQWLRSFSPHNGHSKAGTAPPHPQGTEPG